MNATATQTPTLSALNAIIAEHERHAICYFWQGRGSRNDWSREFEWTWRGRTITVRQSHSESQRNVYYSLTVRVDGAKKDVRTLRRLAAEVAQTLTVAKAA